MFKEKKIRLNFFNVEKKTVFTIFSLILFIIPVIKYGVFDLEEYRHSILTMQIWIKNLNPFLFYYDLIGPGTTLPLGSGLFYFPSIFFIQNMKLYYVITIILCFLIQTFGITKLFKLLKLKHAHILNFVYLFSLSSFCYVYINEWALHPFFYISALPIVTYYLLKFLLTKNKISYYKLILTLGFIAINTHPTITINLSIFLIFITLINSKFFYFKEKYFYFGIILFLGISLETITYIFNQSINYSQAERVNQGGYEILNFFISGLRFIVIFLEELELLNLNEISKFNFSDARAPFSNILFYIAFFQSIILIFKKKSDTVFRLNYIFLLYIIFVLSDFTQNLKIISAVWVLRDYINFLSIILTANFLVNLQNIKISNFILTSIIFFSFLLYFTNIQYLKRGNKYNIINLNQTIKKEQTNILSENKIRNNFSKSYFSPLLYKTIERTWIKDLNNINIFSIRDLLKFNFYPFNYYFKMSDKTKIRKSNTKLHSNIFPKFEEIESDLFFDLFNIQSLFIYDSEMREINAKKFERILTFKLNDKKVHLLNKINTSKILIKKFNDITFLNKLSCQENITKVECILNNRSSFEKNQKIQINRKKINNYLVTNNNEFTAYFILPFLYDDNWRSKNKIYNIKKTLMIIKLNPGEKTFIAYKDTTRIILKILTLFILFSLLIFILKNKKNI